MRTEKQRRVESIYLTPRRFSLMLCLEALREMRVEESRGKESSGEEIRKEWLSSTLFGCF